MLNKTEANRQKTRLFCSLEEIEKKLGIKISQELFSVEEKYPVLISEYYLSLNKQGQCSR